MLLLVGCLGAVIGVAITFAVVRWCANDPAPERRQACSDQGRYHFGGSKV
jgi:hypothetical protein